MKDDIISALNACQAVFGDKYVLETISEWMEDKHLDLESINDDDVDIFLEDIEEIDINLSDVMGGK